MPSKPKTIRQEGLRPYLDRTKAIHNGLGWSDFDERMRMHTPKTKIADDFGMSRSRIIEWANLYKENSVA